MFAIIKNINDLFIPQANAFYRFGEEIFSVELNRLMDSVYSTDELKEMKKDRDNMLQNYQIGKDTLTQKKQEISEKEAENKNDNDWLESNSSDYLSVMKLKPNKAVNIILLLLSGISVVCAGILGFGEVSSVVLCFVAVVLVIIDLIRLKKYFTWKKRYGEFVNGFRTMCQITVDEEKELEDLKNDFSNTELQQRELHSKIEEQGLSMMQKIDASPEVKVAVSKNLESIVKLLRTGKNIIESRLDDNLLNPVDFIAPKQIVLSEDAKEKLYQFTHAFSAVNANKIANEGVLTEQVINQMLAEGKISEEEALQLKSENVISTSVKIDRTNALADSVQSFISLKIAQTNGTIASIEYDKRVADIKKAFRTQFKTIDKKADMLGNVLKKLNLSQNNDETLNALIELTENEPGTISKEQMQAFLEGKVIIEI